MTDNTIVAPGNVAVVTGAALGIGRSMCRRFAEAGMSVVMADVPGDHFDAAIELITRVAPRGHDAILTMPVDVADPHQVQQLHDEVMARLGKVNVLANNAVTRIGRGIDADVAEWRQAMDVNLFGPVYGVRAFLPAMLASGERGVIVNVGSKQGITNPPGHPIYNITKSALKTYTEALEHELRSHPDNRDPRRVTAHAFVFPGQGSQQVGMGRAWRASSAAAREVFDEVDEALGQKLSTLMWEGPEDDLTLTETPSRRSWRCRWRWSGCSWPSTASRSPRRPMWPAIRWANTPRLPRRAPSGSPTPRGC
jgi:NAD(P)-dependent dehydrogenase (short-subunit alcohol dehydrogenase family)